MGSIDVPLEGFQEISRNVIVYESTKKKICVKIRKKINLDP